MPNTSKPIGIKELIERVKSELMQTHDTSQPVFVIGDIELEIGFSVERSASGGLDLQVVQIGGAAAKTETHTVRVRLEPLSTPDDIRKKLSQEQRDTADAVVTRSYGGRSKTEADDK